MASSIHCLFRLARKYLSVQATSTPAERVMSSMGVVLEKRRQSMTGELFAEMGPPPFRLHLIGPPPTGLPPTGLPPFGLRLKPFGLRLKSFGLRLKSYRLPPFGLSHAD